MKKPELIIPCLYGYYTKNKLFACVCSDPSGTRVMGKDTTDAKNKLKNRIKKLKLPYKLKFKWKLV